MANLSIINILPNHVTDIYIKLKSITSVLLMTFIRILMITTQTEKEKILIVFDDMIADIMPNKKFQAIIKELFIWLKKLIILLLSITQCYFSVPKGVRLNSTLNLIMKINSKRELENTSRSHSADNDYKDFVKIYRECTK